MTADDLGQAAVERLDVQLSAQPQRQRDVVHGAARLQPIGQPEAFLRKRQRGKVPLQRPGPEATRPSRSRSAAAAPSLSHRSWRCAGVSFARRCRRAPLSSVTEAR